MEPMEHQSFCIEGTQGRPRSKFDIIVSGKSLWTGPLLWTLKDFLARKYEVDRDTVHLRLVHDYNVSSEPLIEDDNYTMAYHQLLNGPAKRDLPAREFYWEDIEEERVL